MLKNKFARYLDYQSTLLDKTRDFFRAHGLREVITPVLMPHTVTDANLHSFRCDWQPSIGAKPQSLYCQTSPEYAMKRLLAFGSGSIYQIATVCRDGEIGKRHMPCFTLLEWYQLDFDHHQLMDQVAAYLQAVVGVASLRRMSYAEWFGEAFDFDPHTVELDTLIHVLKRFSIDYPNAIKQDKEALLDLLIVSVLEPRLQAIDEPVAIYDYPASQAALARLTGETPAKASRFEIYWRGIELANGYHELTCALTQRQRFLQDNIKRRERDLPEMTLDEALLTALESPGLPDCAGVALGLDRLLMLQGVSDTVDGYGFYADYL